MEYPKGPLVEPLFSPTPCGHGLRGGGFAGGTPPRLFGPMVFLTEILTGAALFAGTTFSPTNADHFRGILSAVKPGDVVCLPVGELDGGLWSFEGLSGDPGAAIHLKGADGFRTFMGGKGWQVRRSSNLVLSGFSFSGRLAPGAACLELTGCGGTVVRDCRFSPEESSVDPKQENPWLVLSGGRSNRVLGCAFQGKRSRRPMLQVIPPESDILVQACHFRDFSRGPGNGYETVQLGQGAPGTKGMDIRGRIAGNLFESCDGEDEILSIKTSANVVEGNTFRGCMGFVTIRAGNSNVIRRNVFLNPGGKNYAGGVDVNGCGNAVVMNLFVQMQYPVLRLFHGDRAVTAWGEGPETARRQTLDLIFADNAVVSPMKRVFDIAPPGPMTVRGEKAELNLPPTRCFFANNLFMETKAEFARGLEFLVDSPMTNQHRADGAGQLGWDRVHLTPGVLQRDGEKVRVRLSSAAVPWPRPVVGRRQGWDPEVLKEVGPWNPLTSDQVGPGHGGGAKAAHGNPSRDTLE